MQKNREYEKFRYNGMPFANELQIIFKNKSAVGEDQFAPSSTTIPIESEDQDEVYRPDLPEDIDLLEGSGDSEEELHSASLGITNELEGVNLTANDPNNSNSGSYGKRKRNEAYSKGKRAKIAPSKTIADSISVMASLSKERSAKMDKIQYVSIAEITEELLSNEEIANDKELLAASLDYVVNSTYRQLFMALKNKPDALMDWVRRMATNPPKWLQSPPA